MVCEGSIVFLQVRLLHPSEYKYEYDNIHIILIYFCNNICFWIRNKLIISLTLPHRITRAGLLGDEFIEGSSSNLGGLAGIFGG